MPSGSISMRRPRAERTSAVKGDHRRGDFVSSLMERYPSVGDFGACRSIGLPLRG